VKIYNRVHLPDKFILKNHPRHKYMLLTDTRVTTASGLCNCDNRKKDPQLRVQQCNVFSTEYLTVVKTHVPNLTILSSVM